ncbi:MAG: DUF2461 domain-containing protein [Myxococcota bacterium]
MARTETVTRRAVRRPSAQITPKLFRFLRDLERNNEREWFQKNKQRYLDEIRDPLLGFVEDFAPRLEKISPFLLADARPVGGSLFRIYRDVRFSRDKRPYKTHAGLHFRHVDGKDVHSAGLYLHLEPGSVFAAIGIWHPDAETLRLVREAIVAHPERWKRASSGRAFRSTFELDGERLQRPPRGYSADHPQIEELKYKSFTASAPYTQRQACAPDFIDHFAQTCKRASPLLEFLTRSIGLDW